MDEKETTEVVETSDDTPVKPSGKKKKWPVVLGIVVAVVVVAAVGFMFWHEQPSFCNAICHSPMDNYVNGYYEDDSAQLASAHRSSDVACLDCHESSISEQATEGIAWISGDYKTDKDGNMVGVKVDNLGTREFCFRCHDDGNASDGEDWSDITAATSQLVFNPHANRHGDQNCNICHKAHSTSVMYCAQCHEDAATLADQIGWTYTKQ